MSLYNMLFGKNPASELLLAMLDKSEADFGRFRDCRTNQEGTQIIVHTRCGGGNRDEYEGVFDEMRGHANYLRDADDDYDCTYADIVFSVPDKFSETVRAIADHTDTTTPAEKWGRLMKEMASGEQTPVTARAMEVGKRIFAAMEENKSQTVSTPEGSVSVITQ